MCIRDRFLPVPPCHYLVPYLGGQLSDLVKAQVQPLELARLPELLPIRGIHAVSAQETHEADEKDGGKCAALVSGQAPTC